MKKIYKFNRNGKQTDMFESVIDCANKLGLNRTYIYRAIEQSIKINNCFYLSYESEDRLGKKSDITVNPTINDFNIMFNYRYNLIQFMADYANTENCYRGNVDRMLKEIKSLNKILES